jgi:hypothetical protein
VQIENWNGTSWSIVPAPKLGGFGGTLFAVTAISANNIWAVGVHGVNQYTQDPLVEHWDGTQWSAIGNSSNGDYNFLLGVSFVSPNNGWAVGTYSYISSPQQTLIEHWNGSSWSDVDDGLMDKILSAVAAISAKDAWAVGYSDYPQTLIEHWMAPNGALSPVQLLVLTASFMGLHEFLEQNSFGQWEVTVPPIFLHLSSFTGSRLKDAAECSR